MAWQPSYGSVCDGIHVSLGALLTVLPAAVFGRSWVCALAGFGIAVAFASLKEFIFDTVWPVDWGGEGDSWADSWQDWRAYLLGAYSGLFVALIGVWFHG